MKKIKIETDRAAAPGGWYSQAFRAGDLVFTAGVTGTDPQTGRLVGPGDIVAQTHQIMKNLSAILEQAGSDLEHVIKTLVFVADIDQFALFNETYKAYFPKDPPARSTMQVGKFNGGMAIEIEAVAGGKDQAAARQA